MDTGHFSEQIQDAASLIGSFLSSFLEEAPQVQLQILTASVKLFLKNPKQQQTSISTILKMATEEVESPDVRDRGSAKMPTIVLCLLVYIVRTRRFVDATDHYYVDWFANGIARSIYILAYALKKSRHGMQSCICNAAAHFK